MGDNCSLRCEMRRYRWAHKVIILSNMTLNIQLTWQYILLTIIVKGTIVFIIVSELMKFSWSKVLTLTNAKNKNWKYPSCAFLKFANRIWMHLILHNLFKIPLKALMHDSVSDSFVSPCEGSNISSYCTWSLESLVFWWIAVSQVSRWMKDWILYRLSVSGLLWVFTHIICKIKTCKFWYVIFSITNLFCVYS